MPTALFELTLQFLTLSLLSFGGGDAYLTIADGLFVQGGTVAAADFYGQLVPVANALPGSILCKILTGIGYLAGFRMGGTSSGLILALAGFAVSVAASGLIFGLVARLLRTFHDVPVFRQISLWVRPIISGLLPNVALSMLRTNLETGAGLFLPEEIVLGASIALAALCLYLLCARRKAMCASFSSSASRTIFFWRPTGISAGSGVSSASAHRTGRTSSRSCSRSTIGGFSCTVRRS